MVAVLEALISLRTSLFSTIFCMQKICLPCQGAAPTPASASPPRNKLRARSPLLFPVRWISLLAAENDQKIVSHLTHYTVLLRKPCSTRLSGATPTLSEV